MAGPLAGLKVVEFAALGPAPFCAMLLADQGADVLRVARPGSSLGPHEVDCRNRASVQVDLRAPGAVDALMPAVAAADVLVEGFRPGVMERLGFGPEACLAVNPRLVYGRMTGWGQAGPLAAAAGHDINYIAISGALRGIGPAGGKPVPPMNLLGDFGGGALLLGFGLLAAVLEARSSGRGQVVDAAMSDGAALLCANMYAGHAAGRVSNERGANLLDGGAHFYDTYACADGKYNYASTGNGLSQHTNVELLKSMANLFIVGITYRGSGPAVADLLGGQVQVMVELGPQAIPHVKAGKLRVLAATTKTRTEAMPEVPTLDESGVKGFDAFTWFALYAPAGTPADVVRTLQTETHRIFNQPDVKSRLAALGAEVALTNGEELAAFQETERKKWAAVLKRAGIEPQ